MKRSGPPRRRRALAPGGRIKAKPRPTSDTLRIYGTVERRAWFVAQRCAFCGSWPTEDRPTQQMHVEGGGMARKADAGTIVPACATCHAEAHHGIESFCRRRGLTREALRAMAADYDAKWKATQHTRTDA